MEQLARTEEQKIGANPQYRTPKKILKRLAEAHVFYELPGSQPFAWDNFSTRNVGLQVNRRIARDFGGDSLRARRAAVAKVSHALKIDSSRWSLAEWSALENWSLVLALMPNLSRWSPQEKQDASKIIRAQAGPNEMRYLRLTQQHSQLRQELLQLGSKE